ncbi:MAG TPA: cupredoxin domain-containing protein [Candidatus Polarisedimenticolia bacterium]
MRMLRTSLLAVAALTVAVATVRAGEPQATKGSQTRGGAVAAKSVAPGETKKFHVTAFENKIAPSTLRVKKGEKVRITFVSRDGNYGIKFKDFEISEKVTPEKPAVVEFTPGEKGSFEFRCTKTWGFKHWSKNGTLVVE